MSDFEPISFNIPMVVCKSITCQKCGDKVGPCAFEKLYECKTCGIFTDKVYVNVVENPFAVKITI